MPAPVTGASYTSQPCKTQTAHLNTYVEENSVAVIPAQIEKIQDILQDILKKNTGRLPLYLTEYCTDMAESHAWHAQKRIALHWYGNLATIILY